MTLTEVIQKDGQRHLYVKSAITSETTQYVDSKIIYPQIRMYLYCMRFLTFNYFCCHFTTNVFQVIYKNV